MEDFDEVCWRVTWRGGVFSLTLRFQGIENPYVFEF